MSSVEVCACKVCAVHDLSIPELITQMMGYSWNYEKTPTHTHTLSFSPPLSPEVDNKMVIRLDGKDWFAFKISANLAGLLRCVRQALETSLTSGLTGRLGTLSPPHREFLSQLNTFTENTTFDNT